MCECNCSDSIGEFRLPSPEDQVLTVAIYRGCDGCDGPAGVDFRLYTKAAAKEDGADKLPLLEFHSGMAAIPVMDAEALAAAISKYVDPDFADWAGRETFDIMEDTVDGTQERFKEARKKAVKPTKKTKKNGSAR